MKQGLKVFVINLDRDSDRLEHMAKELGTLGLAFERFPAVLGNKLPDWLEPYFDDPAGEGESGLRRGEIGCYASHLEIHRRMIDEKIDGPVLVLEDDLTFLGNFPAVLNALDALPSGWEIVRLSNPAKSAVFPAGRLDETAELVRYWRVPNNTGAYLINRAGAEKFLTYRKRRFRAIDEDLRRPWEHGLATYGIEPAPVLSNIFDSSIDKMSGNRDLPARKRFPKARGETMTALRYRFVQFGVIGLARAVLHALVKRSGKPAHLPG